VKRQLPDRRVTINRLFIYHPLLKLPHSENNLLRAKVLTLDDLTSKQFQAHDKKIDTIAIWQCPCRLDNWQHHRAFNDHRKMAHG